MANETKNKQSGSNLTPIIIIGGILLATVFGIYLISQSGDKTDETKASTDSKKTDSKSTAQKGRIPNFNSAAPGANPPNFKGSAAAAVVLEEFADFECGTCKVIHPVMNEIISKYNTRVKVIFRHYPLTQIHKNAYDAAVATEAAGLQGKFWEMQNIIFNNQSSWAKSPNAKQDFAGYAKTIGLDVDRFGNDVLGLPAKSRVDADMKRGRQLNIQSTPSIIVNGKLIPFSQTRDVASLSKVLDAELEAMQSTSQPKDDDKASDKEEDKKDADEKPEDKKDEK